MVVNLHFQLVINITMLYWSCHYIISLLTSAEIKSLIQWSCYCREFQVRVPVDSATAFIRMFSPIPSSIPSYAGANYKQRQVITDDETTKKQTSRYSQ